jgi:integrase
MKDRGDLWRDGFETVLRKMGREDANFHGFRRFPEAVLLGSECPDLLIDYWMGHENDDVASRYGQQLVRNRKFRAEWAAKVGLGYDIPTASTADPAPIAICAIISIMTKQHSLVCQ